MKRETESMLIFSWTIVGMIALIIIVVSLGQRVEAREGFYLMIGAGASDSPKLNVRDGQGNKVYVFEWQDGGEIGCGFGTGIMWEVGDQFLIDWGYQHRSQCNYWDDDETSVDHLFLDLYWFPFE